MPRPLKVYRWIGHRYPDAPPPHYQTEEIVAARSMAEVGRIVGKAVHRFHNLGETGNQQSIDVALSKPGTVFWRGLNEFDGAFHEAES